EEPWARVESQYLVSEANSQCQSDLGERQPYVQSRCGNAPGWAADAVELQYERRLHVRGGGDGASFHSWAESERRHCRISIRQFSSGSSRCRFYQQPGKSSAWKT